MGLTEKIAHQHGIRMMKYGSLNLIAAEDANKILDAFRSERIQVLGIEGFYLRNKSAIPDMDAIADFSELYSVSESIIEAKHFVNNLHQSGILFEFTLK